MSLFKDNVIPGNHGKRFSINVENDEQLEAIKNDILRIEGVKNVKLYPENFPMEFDVLTDKLVQISDIEEIVLKKGFHAVPKGVFNL